MRLFSFPALAVCAAGLLFSQVASAQSKVGVINFQKALLDTKELTKASIPDIQKTLEHSR